VERRYAQEKKRGKVVKEEALKSGADYSELIVIDCAVSEAFAQASLLRMAVNKALAACIRACDAEPGVRVPPDGWHRELCALREEVSEQEKRLLDLALETTKYTY